MKERGEDQNRSQFIDNEVESFLDSQNWSSALKGDAVDEAEATIDCRRRKDGNKDRPFIHPRF